MPDAYRIDEGRFIAESTITGNADAVTVNINPVVPVGKVWTILQASYNPSVSELKTVQLYIVRPNGLAFSICWPVAVTLTTTFKAPFITEGMELKLFPGEYLLARRDSATAGSTMTLSVRYIESDLPYFSYVDPLRPVVSVQRKHGLTRSTGGASLTGAISGERGGAGGGKIGGPQPI